MRPLLFLFIFSSSIAYSQTKVQNPDQVNGVFRAKQSDVVQVIILTVKENAKTDFEDWIDNIFYKALYNSPNQVRKDQLKVTRFLKPYEQNADKTWSYTWIMDPVLSGIDYNILFLLKEEYGEENALKYWEKYLTFFAKPQFQKLFIQTGN